MYGLYGKKMAPGKLVGVKPDPKYVLEDILNNMKKPPPHMLDLKEAK